MPDWFAVIILGVIEGITEFIPISSTGHLLLAERWLGHRSDLFIILIQSGAVLAVLPLFPERLRQFATRWREAATRDYLLKIAAAFVLTGVGGVLMEKNNFKLPDTVVPVAVALLVGGIAFIAVEWGLRNRKPKDEITWAIVLAVGLGQLLAAAFPGTSRSGSTILLALILGLGRPLATEFSFLVGIPTMLAAGGLKLAKTLYREGTGGEDWGLLALGFIVSALVSFVAVKWLLRYVQTHTFVLFGWYRIVLGLILLLFFRGT